MLEGSLAISALASAMLSRFSETEQAVIDAAFDHAMQERQLYLSIALAEAAADGVTINLVSDQFVSNVHPDPARSV